MNTPTMHDCADARESIGQQLRSARIAKGFSIADVAARLRVLGCVVQDIENDDFSRLGAEIFVRGHLSSYCRLVAVDVPPPGTVVAVDPATLSPLQPMTRSSRVQRAVEHSARSLVYVVLSASIGIPVIWFALNAPEASGPAPASLTRLDPVPGTIPAAAPARAAAAAAATPSASTALAAETPQPPVVASLAGFYPQASAPPHAVAAATAGSDAATPGAMIVLQFRERSWLEVRSVDGDRLDEALIEAGDERIYPLDQVGRVTLGNAAGVDVNIDDTAVDISAYRRADVARFKVSSDGRLTPSDG